MKARKPVEIKPSTLSTRATMAKGKLREKMATLTDHSASSSTHSNSEPSWPPQTAATWYGLGNKVLECCAT